MCSPKTKPKISFTELDILIFTQKKYIVKSSSVSSHKPDAYHILCILSIYTRSHSVHRAHTNVILILETKYRFQFVINSIFSSYVNRPTEPCHCSHQIEYIHHWITRCCVLGLAFDFLLLFIFNGLHVRRLIFILFLFSFAECSNCVDEPTQATNRWAMPLTKLGDKRYYIGSFFKVCVIHQFSSSSPFKMYFIFCLMTCMRCELMFYQFFFKFTNLNRN